MYCIYGVKVIYTQQYTNLFIYDTIPFLVATPFNIQYIHNSFYDYMYSKMHDDFLFNWNMLNANISSNQLNFMVVLEQFAVALSFRYFYRLQKWNAANTWANSRHYDRICITMLFMDFFLICIRDWYVIVVTILFIFSLFFVHICFYFDH